MNFSYRRSPLCDIPHTHIQTGIQSNDDRKKAEWEIPQSQNSHQFRYFCSHTLFMAFFLTVGARRTIEAKASQTNIEIK
jgi:hypothetical protein